MDPFVASTLRMLNLDRHYVRAEGAYLWDEEGRRYLDFVAGFGAVNVGHHHPRVVEAIRTALRKEVPNLVKLARTFTRRTRMVHATGSFHGKTLGSLSVTDNARFRRPFEPLVPDVARV